MKRFFLAVSLFVIVIIVGVFIFGVARTGREQSASVTIKDAVLKVEVADNPLTRARGLSGRNSLAEDEGMLFLFPELGVYNFWMKDMKFSLDFIWLVGDRIVGLTQNAPPAVAGAPITIFSPPQPVDKVLEVPAGTVARLNVAVGDKIQLP